MRRSLSLVLCCHCVLNQNAVVQGEARAPGALGPALAWLVDQGWGIIQLPCPEFTYLGPSRPPEDVEGYDTPEYRAHCRSLAGPVLDNLEAYRGAGYRLEGLVAITSSPSCDSSRGVFLRVLKEEAAARGLDLGATWTIADSPGADFDPEPLP